MPLPVYDGFLDKCDQKAPGEFRLLKTAVVIRRPKDDHYERIVEIQCDLGDANKLLSLAVKIYPDAVADISSGITTSTRPPPLG
jgi:hypothetical protein